MTPTSSTNLSAADLVGDVSFIQQAPPPVESAKSPVLRYHLPPSPARCRARWAPLWPRLADGHHQSPGHRSSVANHRHVLRAEGLFFLLVLVDQLRLEELLGDERRHECRE